MATPLLQTIAYLALSTVAAIFSFMSILIHAGLIPVLHYGDGDDYSYYGNHYYNDDDDGDFKVRKCLAITSSRRSVTQSYHVYANCVKSPQIVQYSRTVPQLATQQ
jgi:hypothetical protein